MDGPPKAEPPMSAPLLLWVVLLRWASGGGSVRGGRTWQHCTGRSEGRAGCTGVSPAGKRAGTAVLPWVGCSPRCQGRPQKACSALGGMPHVGQPLAGSPALVFRCSVSTQGGRVTVMPQDATDSRMRGHSCACSPHNANRGATSPLGALGRAVCLSLWHKRCPRLCWRQRGGEGLEEGEESREVPLESPSCPGLLCALTGTTSALPAAKVPVPPPPAEELAAPVAFPRRA